MGNIASLAPRDSIALSGLDEPRPPSGRPDGAPSDLDFAPVSMAYRSDGWTPARQRAFIQALAECGIVGEAAARVGMTEQTARRLRARPDAQAFGIAWDAAIRIGADRLRSVAYERAVNGSVRRRYYHGKVIDEERVYDNRLLTYLLGKLEPRRRSARFDCGDFVAAAEHGLPIPGVHRHRAPLRQTQDGWVTNFPPPEGFDGQEEGSHGDDDYWRALSPQEEALVEASIARRRAQAARARNIFFDRLDDFFAP